MPLPPDVPPHQPGLPRKSALPPAARPPAGRPAASDAPPPPVAPAAAADGTALTPGVADVQARGKRPLAAYTPGDDDAPPPAPAGPTFSSKGLVPPAEPGERVEQAAGPFELRVAWGRGPGGMAATGVAVRANAAGERVTIDGGGAMKLGDAPLAPPPETPWPLAGGGAVTDWGGGYVVVESDRGDSVSVFARGEHVDFLGQLA